jgi:hypothetical protein
MKTFIEYDGVRSQNDFFKLKVQPYLGEFNEALFIELEEGTKGYLIQQRYE